MRLRRDQIAAANCERAEFCVQTNTTRGAGGNEGVTADSSTSVTTRT